MRFVNAFVVAAIAGIGMAFALAQEPLYQLRVDVPLVSVDVRVTDASNQPMTSLTEKDFIVVEDVADLYGPATDLAVFDIALAADRQVEDHRDLLPAKRAFEEVFHKFAKCALCIDISGWFL